MKRNMFNENGRYKEAGIIINEQTYKALKPIFNYWLEEGYGPREISHIMLLATHDLELESVLFSDDKIKK